MRKPRAAALAHHLVAQMGHQNAVVVSQAVLAKLMGCSVETVKRAVRDLVAERWIQVVRIGKGKNRPMWSTTAWRGASPATSFDYRRSLPW